MIEQNTHYYPYGELIGDISTQSSVQDYKYGGKELDRTYGLDLYDETTVENIACSLAHEWYGHYKCKYGDYNKTHTRCYQAAIASVWYQNTTEHYKQFSRKQYEKYYRKETRKRK